MNDVFPGQQPVTKHTVNRRLHVSNRAVVQEVQYVEAFQSCAEMKNTRCS